MFLIYIDESGKPHITDKEDYVLGALIINENDWQYVDNQVKILKQRYFPMKTPSEVELHASDIIHHRGVFKDIRRQDTLNLLEDSYSLISNINCVLIASIIRKDNIYSSIKRSSNIYHWIENRGFTHLFERICIYLDKVNQTKISINLPIDYGILFIDSVNAKYDQLLRKKIIKLLRFGTSFINNRYLIEDPLFIISHYRNMVQLSDLVSFIVRRKFRPSSTGFYHQKYDDFFNIIENKFDTCRNGALLGCGIKIFPP